jgi:hypothetical protein
MEYQEFYHGEAITVTTHERAPGAWTSLAEFVIDGSSVRRPGGGSEQQYPSEEEARRAAVSTAAAAIDRARSGHGKP